MSPKEILLVAAGYLIGSLSFAFLLDTFEMSE